VVQEIDGLAEILIGDGELLSSGGSHAVIRHAA
jgi:hypothetical protein